MSRFFRRKEKLKDFSLNSGERQIGDTLELIREDHLARYRLVQDYLDVKSAETLNGLDIFCGNGYGSFMLSKKNLNLYITGIDGSKEAIKQASTTYKCKNNLFLHRLFPFDLKVNSFDLIVCFESLEHVEKDKQMFLEMFCSAKSNALLFVSVPNDACHNLEKNPHPFHFRHYVHEKFLKEFQGDLDLIEWYGQNVYEFENGICLHKLLPAEKMKPIKNVEGQVNIYVFRKK